MKQATQVRLVAALKIIILIASVFGFCELAFATNPLISSDPRALAGSWWTQLGAQATIDSATVTCFMEEDDAEPWAIPENTQVVITCDSDGPVYFFWTQADNSELTISTTTLVVTDSGTTGAPGGAAPDGRVPGFTYKGGYRTNFWTTKQFNVNSTSVGRRINVCSAGGRPCDDDTDCLVGETCSTSGTAFGSITKAYLCGVTLTGAAIDCQVNAE